MRDDHVPVTSGSRQGNTRYLTARPPSDVGSKSFRPRSEERKVSAIFPHRPKVKTYEEVFVGEQRLPIDPAIADIEASDL
jgi:hypothetical protein